jgi:hypothetical protein
LLPLIVSLALPSACHQPTAPDGMGVCAWVEIAAKTIVPNSNKDFLIDDFPKEAGCFNQLK